MIETFIKPNEILTVSNDPDLVCEVCKVGPLWQGEFHKNYSKHKAVNKDGTVVPVFRPSLCSHMTPALEVSDEFATPALYYFLKGMLTNWMDDPRYTIHKEAGAFFQGGYDRPNDNWFLIEFWNTRGVERFIEYVNEHYNPSDESYKDFL